MRRAIATISAEPLNGEDATEQAGEASATLTTAIVKETVLYLETDDDFCFATGSINYSCVVRSIATANEHANMEKRMISNT